MRTKRIWPGDVDNGEIQILEPRLVFQNRFMDVYDDVVLFPGTGQLNTEGTYLRVQYPATTPKGIVIVPITDENKIVLVEQFRHSPRIRTEELPRGFGEIGKGDLLTMRNELLEETGYDLKWGDHYPLGHLVTDSGKLHDIPLLVATRVGNKAKAQPEFTEAIYGMVEYSFSELKLRCQKGLIVDMFTVAAITRLDPHFDGDIFNPKIDFVDGTPLTDIDDFE